MQGDWREAQRPPAHTHSPLSPRGPCSVYTKVTLQSFEDGACGRVGTATWGVASASVGRHGGPGQFPLPLASLVAHHLTPFPHLRQGKPVLQREVSGVASSGKPFWIPPEILVDSRCP